ncbi:MAG: MTH938/NDUFAF3 family protein [Hyphomicrobiales bacterium]
MSDENLHLPGQHAIDTYGNMGFRFADMSHKGSLLILPTGTSDWQVNDGEGLNLEQFSQIIEQNEKIDILILGMGEKMYLPPKEIRQACQASGIVIEFMSTSNAVRTYNVLLSEQRLIAAALIAID